jgi:pyruvate/2-oxoglutarate dehydrogenase complex dihydrolipoamide acyltransferase (E2) component
MAKAIVASTVGRLSQGGRQIPQTIKGSSSHVILKKFLVKNGKRVRAGQVIAIIEVDGKDYSYKATSDGIITISDLAPGEALEGGIPIASIYQSSEDLSSAIRSVVVAALTMVSPMEAPGIVAAAVAAAPGYTMLIVRTAIAIYPGQMQSIARAAAIANPAMAAQIMQSVNPGGSPLGAIDSSGSPVAPSDVAVAPSPTATPNPLPKATPPPTPPPVSPHF